MASKNNQEHYRLYIPPTLTDVLLQVYHDSPLSKHLVVFKTYKRLYEAAYWPKMWSDIKHLYQMCQTIKSDNKKNDW